MAIALQAVLDRLAAIEIEALAGMTPAVTADAKAFMLHTQEAFPYFVHRVGNLNIDYDSHDFDTYEVEVTARLVVGHMTEGYHGQPESVLYSYIPVVIEAINARELLQSAAYPTALDGLVGARVSGSSGMRVYESAGIQPRQVGTEFTVVCEFLDDLTQRYR